MSTVAVLCLPIEARVPMANATPQTANAVVPTPILRPTPYRIAIMVPAPGAKAGASVARKAVRERTISLSDTAAARARRTFAGTGPRHLDQTVAQSGDSGRALRANALPVMASR